MCTYIIQKADLLGSAKGPAGWFPLEAATVAFDHPFHAPFEHALLIDFMNPDKPEGRVAVEMSASSARALVKAIEAALASGHEARVDLEDPIEHVVIEL